MLKIYALNVNRKQNNINTIIQNGKKVVVNVLQTIALNINSYSILIQFMQFVVIYIEPNFPFPLNLIKEKEITLDL